MRTSTWSLCCCSIFLAFFLGLCHLSHLSCECLLTTNWKGTLSESELSRRSQSQPSASISQTTEPTLGCAEGRWYKAAFGGGWVEVLWPESFRKQLARCYANFRSNLISCYQSRRSLCSAQLQTCWWGLFPPSGECLHFNCLYSFDWASCKRQICGTTYCFVYWNTIKSEWW